MKDIRVEQESILLVDDNPLNLQVLFQTLEEQKCKLLVAKNGETALNIANRFHPNLILLDIMMPGIDGFEVCRRIMDDPATSDIPVIFLSALGNTEDKVKGLQFGAVDYISKPFQPEEVLARVNTHLTIYRLKSELQHQRDQLEKELQVVSEVQRRLLVKKIPEIDGIECAVHYETSRYAGGDYYDFSLLPDGRWGFFMADAEGHSAPAAVLMAMTCALFRSYPGVSGNPGDVLKYVNRSLLRVNDKSFITAVYAVHDPKDKSLKFSCAGHPPPAIYRIDDNQVVEAVGESVFPMGIYEYDTVATGSVHLQSGDRFILYTDGLIERFNPSGKPYTKERLLQQFEAIGRNAPRKIVDDVIADIERFAEGRPAEDDMAILVCAVK